MIDTHRPQDRDGRIVVLHVLPDLQVGGGQQVVLRTVGHLDPSRFRSVVCYFLSHHDLAARFRDAGVEPILIEHGRRSRTRVLRDLIGLIREQGVDLVHVQGTPLDKLYGQLAALLSGLPVVRTLHGPRFRPRAWRSILRNGAMELLDFVLEPLTVHHYIAVSGAVRASWRSYLRLRGVADEAISVIPNGVLMPATSAPATTPKASSLREEFRLDGAFPVLINVGRLDRRKGQRILIPALRKVLDHHSRAVLLFVGDGPMRAELEQAASDDGVQDHVRFAGLRSDVPDLLSVSDLLVFPSVGEGMPLAVIEAMAAGVPVLAFGLPGLGDVIHDGVAGRLVQERSPEAFVRVLLEMLADGDVLRRMGQGARQAAAERFDIERCVVRVEDVYSRVTQLHGRGAGIGRNVLAGA